MNAERSESVMTRGAIAPSFARAESRPSFSLVKSTPGGVGNKTGTHMTEMRGSISPNLLIANAFNHDRLSPSTPGVVERRTIRTEHADDRSSSSQLPQSEKVNLIKSDDRPTPRTFDLKNTVAYTPKVETLRGEFSPIDLGRSNDLPAPTVIRKDLPANTEPQVSPIIQTIVQSKENPAQQPEQSNSRDVEHTILPKVEAIHDATVFLNKQSTENIKNDALVERAQNIEAIVPPVVVQKTEETQSPIQKVNVTKAAITSSEEQSLAAPVALIEDISIKIAKVEPISTNTNVVPASHEHVVGLQPVEKPLEEQMVVVPVTQYEGVSLQPAEKTESLPPTPKAVPTREEHVVIDLHQIEKPSVIPVVLKPRINPEIVVNDSQEQKDIEVAVEKQVNKQASTDFDFDYLAMERTRKKRIDEIEEELAHMPLRQPKIVDNADPSLIDSVSSLMTSERQSVESHQESVHIPDVTPEPLKLLQMKSETDPQLQKDQSIVHTETRAQVVSRPQLELVGTINTIIPPITEDALPTVFKERKPIEKKTGGKLIVPFTIDKRALKARVQAAKAVFDIFPRFDFQIALTADAVAAALPKRTKDTTQQLSQILGAGDLSDEKWREELTGEEKVTRMDMVWKVLNAIYKYPPVRLHNRGEHVTKSYANWTVSGKTAEVDPLVA